MQDCKLLCALYDQMSETVDFVCLFVCSLFMTQTMCVQRNFVGNRHHGAHAGARVTCFFCVKSYKKKRENKTYLSF